MRITKSHFSVTKEQIMELNKWLSEMKIKPVGAIGGNVSVEFSLTSLGVIIVGKYIDPNGNKHKIDLTNYDLF